MPDSSEDRESFSRFLDFINHELDLSALDPAPRLTDAEIETLVMPLIRDDIYQQTLLILSQLLRSPQRDHWRARLAPFHREVRACLAQSLAAVLEQRYPGRLSSSEWIDAASFVITLAWLVRKQIDSDDTPASEN